MSDKIGQTVGIVIALLGVLMYFSMILLELFWLGLENRGIENRSINLLFTYLSGFLSIGGALTTMTGIAGYCILPSFIRTIIEVMESE